MLQDNDVLAAVLEQSGMRGAVYCQTQAVAPWGLRFPAQDGAIFHCVVTGTCWLSQGSEHMQLAAGDLVLVKGGAHSLSDAPKSPKLELERWLEQNAGVVARKLGGERGRPTSEVMCGVYMFDRAARSHPVLELLPERLQLRTSGQRSDLAGTLASLHGERARGPLGSALVTSRLLDVMFVQIVRAWVESAPHAAGWLGALEDPTLAKALAALHREPGRDWSVDALARHSGTSRATLARRFSAQVGEAPLAYLTRLRLDEAARRLVRGREALATIARDVGYTSEFAFSRAFRRHYGEAPGRYREERT